MAPATTNYFRRDVACNVSAGRGHVCWRERRSKRRLYDGLSYWGFFLLNKPMTLLAGFWLPLVIPFSRPFAIPFTSGTNFGSEVVPSTENGIPIPPRVAFNLKASSFDGLTVPAPVIMPMAGTVRLMLLACVPSGATRTSELKF